MRAKMAAAALALHLMAAPLHAQNAQNSTNAANSASNAAGTASTAESSSNALREKSGYEAAFTQEIVGSRSKGGFASRTIGSYERNGYKVFGLFNVDADSSYFAKAEASKEIGRGFEAVFDFEKSRSEGAKTGFGLGYDFGTNLVSGDIHVLPVNFTRNGFKKEIDVEAFLHSELGKGFYLTGRTQAKFPYAGRIDVVGELDAGRRLGRGFSAFVRGAYDKIWGVKGGVSYTWHNRK